jgi:hypothetical protein
LVSDVQPDIPQDVWVVDLMVVVLVICVDGRVGVEWIKVGPVIVKQAIDDAVAAE